MPQTVLPLSSRRIMSGMLIVPASAGEAVRCRTGNDATTACKPIRCHDGNCDQTTPIDADALFSINAAMRLYCGDVS
ncbi:hypothetical protein [Xanthomonas phaseoli]|uniref:hypothetical protein n=1 Tax=Xanthomonas phaseoli TaxID=1985254 RepID=UPI0003082CFF|nr:hypothetical protein [Xanthomonas phaseoli]